MVFDVEGIHEAPFDLFKLGRSRKGVPYHLGAREAASRAAAATALPPGILACRVGEEYRAYENDVDPGARHVTGPLSLTSAVTTTRMGHRRTALDRAVVTVSSAVTFRRNVCCTQGVRGTFGEGVLGCGGPLRRNTDIARRLCFALAGVGKPDAARQRCRVPRRNRQSSSDFGPEQVTYQCDW